MGTKEKCKSWLLKIIFCLLVVLYMIISLYSCCYQFQRFNDILYFTTVTTIAFFIIRFLRETGETSIQQKIVRLIIILLLPMFLIKGFAPLNQYINFIFNLNQLNLSFTNEELIICINDTENNYTLLFSTVILTITECLLCITILRSFMGWWPAGSYHVCYFLKKGIQCLLYDYNLNPSGSKDKKLNRFAKVYVKESEENNIKRIKNYQSYLTKCFQTLIRKYPRRDKQNNYDPHIVLILGESGMGKSMGLLSEALKMLPSSGRPVPFSLSRHSKKVPVYAKLSAIPSIRDNNFEDLIDKLDGDSHINIQKSIRKELFQYILNNTGVESDKLECYENVLENFHSKGKIVYFLDGINEIKTNLNKRSLNYLFQIIHQVTENNLCFAASTPMEKDYSFPDKVYKKLELTHIDTKSLSKLLKTFHISKRDLMNSPVITCPFFLGLILKIKPTIECENKKLSDMTSYQLINAYILTKIPETDNIKEILSELSVQVCKAYTNTKIVNGNFNIDYITEYEEEEKRQVIKNFVKLKIIKKSSSNSNQVRFYHDWFWRYFIALGCEISGNYWENYCCLEYGSVPPAAPAPFELIKNKQINSALAMYIGNNKEQLNQFLVDCENYLSDNNHNYTHMVVMMEYIVEHFLPFIQKQQNQSRDDVCIQLEKIFNGFNRRNLQREDFRTKVLWAKTAAFCDMEIQADLINRIFSTKADWLKKQLLSSYQNKISEFQDAVSKLASVLEEDQWNHCLLQIKTYFLTQFASEMYKNRSFYRKLFKIQHSCSGGLKRIEHFIFWRYFDLDITWLLYFSLTLFLFYGFCAAGGSQEAVLIVRLVKGFGLFIIIGSFLAWVKQCFYPIDVYLTIFGQASENFTMSELIDMLAEKRKNKLFGKFFENARDHGFGGFLPVLLDWVKIRPSVVFLFALLLSQLWPNHIFQGPIWFQGILLPLLTLMTAIPVTDYIFLYSDRHTPVNNAATPYRAAATALLLLFCLFSVSIHVSIFITHTIACVILLMLIVVIIAIPVFYIGHNARNLVSQDNARLRQIKAGSTADIAIFKEMHTSGFQAKYLYRINRSFFITEEWLNHCKNECVEEVFYEMDIPYKVNEASQNEET